MDDSKVLRGFLFLAVLFVRSSGSPVILNKPNEGNCNPKSDMVFVLNGNTTVSEKNFQKQKDFVHDIVKNHNSPAGAVHVNIIVCSDANITNVGFLTSKHEILSSLAMLRKPKPGIIKNGRPQCITSLSRTFSQRERHNSARMAVFFIGEEDKWSKQDTNLLSTEAERAKISLLIVGVGIQSFSVLNAIQNIVNNKNRKFYVLSSYDGLKHLSEELTTGPCLPMSLEIEETLTTSTTPEPLTLKRKCRAIAEGTVYLKEIPFLGWQRHTCPVNTIINTHLCKCQAKPTTVKPEVTLIQSTEDMESTPLTTKRSPVAVQKIRKSTYNTNTEAKMNEDLTTKTYWPVISPQTGSTTGTTSLFSSPKTVTVHNLIISS